MSEEMENTEATEEEVDSRSIWDILNEDEPKADDYEEEQEEADEEVVKQTKLEKKLSAKMEGMEKKFEQTMLRERIGKFEAEADELTLDMFKTVASDVKTVEDFDKVMGLVNKQAAELRAKAEKYQKQLEEQAAQQTANAWGTGPIGTPARRPDDETELMKKIEGGDSAAALAALLHGDKIVGDRF